MIDDVTSRSWPRTTCCRSVNPAPSNTKILLMISSSPPRRDSLTPPTMKFVAVLLVLVGSAFAFRPIFTPKSPPKTIMKEYGASSTSFYTTTEKKDSYESLDDVLATKCKDEKVRQVIRDMLEVCAEITDALRSALVTVEGSMNDFGDAQLSVDVSSVKEFS